MCLKYRVPKSPFMLTCTELRRRHPVKTRQFLAMLYSQRPLPVGAGHGEPKSQPLKYPRQDTARDMLRIHNIWTPGQPAGFLAPSSLNTNNYHFSLACPTFETNVRLPNHSILLDFPLDARHWFNAMVICFVQFAKLMGLHIQPVSYKYSNGFIVYIMYMTIYKSLVEVKFYQFSFNTKLNKVTFS